MPPYTNKLFPILILVSVIFMGIGYASINSISIDIVGEITAKSPNGVFITDIKYVKDENSLDTENITIYNANQTIVNSLVSLDGTNSSSNVKLEITVYNSNKEDYVFVGAFYETESAAKGVKGDAPDFNKQKLLRKSRVHIHIKCGL